MLLVALALVLQTIFGMSFATQVTPDGAWPHLDVLPSHNWAARPLDCAAGAGQHWASVYRPSTTTTIPDECQGLPLLWANEPELRSQANMKPQDMADSLQAFAPYPRLYCCGTLANAQGLQYVAEVLALYYADHAVLPMLEGLHIHAYTYGSPYDAKLLAQWRMVADLFGWELVVSEYACIGQTMEDSAACLPGLHDQLVEALQPEAMFTFVYDYKEPQGWPTTRLWDAAAGDWSPVGEAWLEMTGYEAAALMPRQVYAPVVAN